jgi:GxxExxY protein
LRVGTAKALDPKLSEISRDVVDCAYQVHSKLGPGLLESVYRECLVYEIKRRGLRVDLELDVPIIYDGHPLTSQLRLDLLIEGELIVELKAIESVLAVHKAQILSYLRLSNKRLGLLLNCNVPLIKDGIFRIAN